MSYLTTMRSSDALRLGAHLLLKTPVERNES